MGNRNFNLKRVVLAILLFLISLTSCNTLKSSQFFLSKFTGIKKPTITISYSNLVKYYSHFISDSNINLLYASDTPFVKYARIFKNEQGRFPLICFVEKNKNRIYIQNCFDDMRSNVIKINSKEMSGILDTFDIRNYIEFLSKYKFQEYNGNIFNGDFGDKNYYIVLWCTFMGNKLKKDKYLGSLKLSKYPVYIFNFESVKSCPIAIP